MVMFHGYVSHNQMVDHVPKGLKSLWGTSNRSPGDRFPALWTSRLDSLGFPGKLGIAGTWGKFGDDFCHIFSETWGYCLHCMPTLPEKNHHL